MSKNPRTFKQATRLIVNMEASTVASIDSLMEQRRQHAHGNRAEFVRRAVERELARCKSDDFHTP